MVTSTSRIQNVENFASWLACMQMLPHLEAASRLACLYAICELTNCSGNNAALNLIINSSKQGVCFATASLPVCKYCTIVTIQHSMHNRLDIQEKVFLRAVFAIDSVKGESVAVLRAAEMNCVSR